MMVLRASSCWMVRKGHEGDERVSQVPDVSTSCLCFRKGKHNSVTQHLYNLNYDLHSAACLQVEAPTAWLHQGTGSTT